MTTVLIAPPADVPVLALAKQGRVLVCFCRSDDWTAMTGVAGQLAISKNAPITVYYTEPGDQPPQDRVCLPPLDNFASPNPAVEALNDMGLRVELADCPASKGRLPELLDACPNAGQIMMTTAFSSVVFGAHGESRAVRLVEKPIWFFRADQVTKPARHNPTGPAFVAVSLSERSTQVVQSAADYAATLGTQLNVVHVVDILHDFSRPDNLMSLMGACEILGNAVAHDGFHPDGRLSYGRVADVFTRPDLTKGAAFVALGVDLNEETSDAIVSDHLRDSIVRNAPCPVLLIPARAVSQSD